MRGEMENTSLMTRRRREGLRWMADLINNIVEDGCIPDDWRKSILVPVYKGKCDPLVCGSYRAIKLLEQPMKVLERVLEKRIRCQVSNDNMQLVGSSGGKMIVITGKWPCGVCWKTVHANSVQCTVCKKLDSQVVCVVTCHG